MYCDRLLDTFRDHPDFAPNPCHGMVRQLAELWRASKADRPDHACLEAVWDFGCGMASASGQSGLAAKSATPANVASCLEIIIVEGETDPFVGLTPDIVDSHVLTSHRPVSLELCKLLRRVKPVVHDDAFGAFGSAFVRAVVLGFAWDERLPGGGSLSALAEGASPADLLRAFRFASAIAADRKTGSAETAELKHSSEQFRTVCDGIVSALHRFGHGPSLDEQSRQVVRVIELERVVQAMVDLLTLTGDARQQALGRASAAFGLGRPSEGPISHLREYVALGTPLIRLVGHQQQADVRRDIERLMEGISSQVLPGFPGINSLGSSRRPSELLRRLRFLVRGMVLEAAKPGSEPVFREFRRDLFHGERGDCLLAAAKIAFERPARASGWKAPADYDKCEDPVYLGLRSKLQNLQFASGFQHCSAASAASHPFIGALKSAVRVDVDTWSDARDGDSAALPEAILDVLRGAGALIDDVDDDALVRAVFDDAVVGSSMGNADRSDLGESREGFFFRLKPAELKWQFEDQFAESVRRAIESGLSGFQRFIRDNSHREFDRPELQRIAGWAMFDLHDEDVGGDDGAQCREWLKSWAFVTSGEFERAADLVGDSVAANSLATEVVNRPFEQDAYSGSSLLFRYADAAAEGNIPSLTALDVVILGESAREVIDAAEPDMVGRPIGVALSQGCSSGALSKLLGPGRGFDVSFGPTVDKVTPSMAAVRFAARSANDLENRRRTDLVLANDPAHQHGKDPHDSRGWRLIHHAFAGGNLAAARALVRRDKSCVQVRAGDNTTFLIEAIRHVPKLVDPGELFRAAWEMLKALEPAEQLKVLRFEGPESTLGTRLSLVSAALRTQGRWSLLIDGLQDASQREAILSVVGPRELAQLLRDANESRFTQFCQLYVQIPGGRERLRAALSEIEPSAAILAISGIRAGDRLGRDRSARAILGAQKKLKELFAYDALDLARTASISRNSALHELVEFARQSDHRDANAGLLYDLAWDLMQSAPMKDRSSLVSSPNLEGESPVWLASRYGMHSVALALAHFMGDVFESPDRKWLEAARVIRDPQRYQDGVDASRRLFRNEARLLCLGYGTDANDGGRLRSVVLSGNPLPEDINVRSARTWLFENANQISQRLRAHFGVDAEIPASAFVNWLAHLAMETGVSVD